MEKGEPPMNADRRGSWKTANNIRVYPRSSADKTAVRYALLLLTLPALLALAACGPDAYKGTKDAPDTCELCDDGTGDTGGTDGGTGGDTGGSDGGTGGGSILSNPVQVSAGGPTPAPWTIRAWSAGEEIPLGRPMCRPSPTPP